MILMGKLKYIMKNLSQCDLSITDLTWTGLRLNLGHHIDRLVTNCPSHGTATKVKDSKMSCNYTFQKNI
jgi:hypothetical protein